MYGVDALDMLVRFSARRQALGLVVHAAPIGLIGLLALPALRKIAWREIESYGLMAALTTDWTLILLSGVCRG